MSKQSGYLKRKKTEINVYRQAEKETFVQFMSDMFQITLNDSDVMGKDVFGEERIRRLVNAVSENYDIFCKALEKGPEADFYQDKLDARLRRIFKDKLVPFKERYPWVKEQVY